jgi:hypothetical protein
MPHEPKFQILMAILAAVFTGGVALMWPKKSRAIGGAMVAFSLLGLLGMFLYWPESSAEHSISTDGGGTGGFNAGGGGGGKGAPGGNGGTYIGGNQYNYSIQQPPVEQPSFPDKPDFVSLSIGGNPVQVSTSEMRNHRVVVFGPSDDNDKRFIPFRTDDLPPIAFSLKNEQLLISTDLYQGESEPAVKLRDNAILEVPFGWDRNSNSSALEIVDGAGCPVFQFVRETPFQATLTGYFMGPSGKLMFADKGFEIGSKKLRCELKQIFKYPSWKYGGKYADGSN